MASVTRLIPRARRRRGQTLIIALAIMFLLVLLGSIFVTLVMRNLQRVSRQGETEDALSLALAGLQYAAGQFRSSPEGADWRPRASEPLWRLPQVAAPPSQRLLDPDYEWLSDYGSYRRPFVRFASGRGRFLLRVTYTPMFRPASAASETAGRADEFDPNSGMIHIEAIGRPGEFDANDPTFLRNPNQPTVKGPARKVEAFVPIGLLDQLWWITNHTNEPGPANLGVPPFRQPNAAPDEPATLAEYPAVFHGAIRSNVSLQWQGRNVLRVYPSRAEGLFVKGDISFATRGNQSGPGATQPVLRIDVLDDTPGGPAGSGLIPPDDQNDDPTDDTLLLSEAARESSDPLFEMLQSQQLQNSGRTRRKVLHDERHLRSDVEARSRSTRIIEPPLLDQEDPATGTSRWLRLTRDSGGTVQVGNRLINAGWYGLTDRTLPPTVRARGLYLDNFADIQYQADRRRVRNEWLRRGTERTGWYGDYYIPAVKDDATGNLREITDILLTRVLNPVTGQIEPVIRIRRSDPDVRQVNHPAGASTDPRLFYDLTNVTPSAGGGTGTLSNPTQTRDFAFPENGVLYAEGSVRVRGVVGMPGLPRQLTIVSGGTIYVEGNVLKGDGASQVALLAQDYVALNPTAFNRIEPGADVFLEPHAWNPNTGLPTRWHFHVPQDRQLDFTVSSAQSLNSALLFLQHSAVEGDVTSETAVTLNLPVLGPVPTPWPDWGRDRYNFQSTVPALGTQLFYMFHQIAAGAPVGWAESNFLSRQGNPGNFEQKTFVMNGPTSGGAPLPAGMEGRYRLVVGPHDGPSGPTPTLNGQPYWLSRLAVVPTDRPLPIRIEAVIYAYTGSWFVIPPPFFNPRPDDTRFRFNQSGVRHAATQQPALTNDPNNVAAAAQSPFYNEPLNIDIQVIGAINENMPAEPSDVAAWTSHTWVSNLDNNPTNGNADNDPSVWPPVHPDDPTNWVPTGRSRFSPRLSYRYDASLRRLVRVRFQRPYQANNFRAEEIAWAAPGPIPAPAPGSPPITARALATIVNEALLNDSYVELLPVLPRLPVGPLLYEGNPL